MALAVSAERKTPWKWRMFSLGAMLGITQVRLVRQWVVRCTE